MFAASLKAYVTDVHTFLPLCKGHYIGWTEVKPSAPFDNLHTRNGEFNHDVTKFSDLTYQANLGTNPPFCGRKDIIAMSLFHLQDEQEQAMIRKDEITTDFKEWKKDKGDECNTLKLPDQKAFTPTKRNSRAGRDSGNSSSPKPTEDDSVNKGVLLGSIFPMCVRLINLENELQEGNQQPTSNTLTSVKESVVQLCHNCTFDIVVPHFP